MYGNVWWAAELLYSAVSNSSSRLWKLHVRHLGHLRSFKCWHIWHLDVRNLHIWDFDLGDFDVRHLQTQSNRISTQTRTCKLISLQLVVGIYNFGILTLKTCL